jgi:hypothetical protein
MYTSQSSLVVLATLVGLAGCGVDAPEFRFETNVGELRFVAFSEDVGVFPSQDVLFDPNNPFRASPLSQFDRFLVQSTGSNVASFYGWATGLAREPTGENQTFAAQSLQRMVELGAEADEENLEAARVLAIRGFQNVLDFFPDSQGFTAQNVPFRLATVAYQGIVDLAVTRDELPQGDWVLVQTEDGIEAILGSGREEIDEDAQ